MFHKSDKVYNPIITYELLSKDCSMKKTSPILISIFLMAFSCSIFAESEDTAMEKKVKPDDDKVNPLENVDINIIKRDDKTIETHSVNGIVYKVKITPDNGPAYYFYDTDGNGSFDRRSDRDIKKSTVQQWKIFQW